MQFKNKHITGLISVVIPVYKDAKGLHDTLSSLAHQTIPESEYEIIVGNDGGDENVSSVCRSFTNVCELKISPNRGSYYTRNRALEVSNGEFIAFVDADISLPQYWLEKGRNELNKADYVGGPVIIDNSKIKEPAHLYESYHGFPTENFFYEQHFCVTANLFVKRKIFEKIGGFDERLRSGGDNEFGKRVFLSGSYKQIFTNELPVNHPPRGFAALVKKTVRLHEGRICLNKLYPERYNYRTPTPRKLVASMLLPPKTSSVNKAFKGENGFSFLSKYIFIWKFKFFTQLNLYKLYYGSTGRKYT